MGPCAVNRRMISTEITLLSCRPAVRNVQGYQIANAGTMAKSGVGLPLLRRIKPTPDKAREAITSPRVTGAPRNRFAAFMANVVSAAGARRPVGPNYNGNSEKKAPRRRRCNKHGPESVGGTEERSYIGRGRRRRCLTRRVVDSSKRRKRLS